MENDYKTGLTRKPSDPWSGFTAAEIQHAQDYIRSLGGNAW